MEVKDIAFIRIVVAVGLVIFLISSITPWITFTFLGQTHSASLTDIYQGIIQLVSESERSYSPSPSQDFGGFSSRAFFEYGDSALAVFLTLVLFPIAAIDSIAAAVSGKRKAAFSAGILALIASGAWIYAVESVKIHIADAAGSSLFGAAIANAIISFFSVGYGPYIGIFGAIIMMVAIAKREKEIVS